MLQRSVEWISLRCTKFFYISLYPFARFGTAFARTTAKVSGNLVMRKHRLSDVIQHPTGTISCVFKEMP